MKKKLIIILFMMGCVHNVVLPDLVTIEFSTDNFSTAGGGGGSRLTVNVPGFDMKYDTVNLLVNNNSTGAFFTKQAVGDIVRSVTITPNTYDFYMSSERRKLTEDALDSGIIYSDHLVFTAILNDVEVTQDMSLILPTEIQQALLLFEKAGADSPPYVKHAPTLDGSDWGDALMIADDLYYYLFLYGGWRYEIDYSFNGDANQIIRTFDIGKIYVYSINGIGINITDPFDEIIWNN